MWKQFGSLYPRLANVRVSRHDLRHYLLPHPGTLVTTLIIVTTLFYAGSAGAFPFRPTAAPSLVATTMTIGYQGRLADASGNPLTGSVPIVFRLYSTSSGGTHLWEEAWTDSNSVRVSAGLFSLMLGSLTPIPSGVLTGPNTPWLGITVGSDSEMSPRVQLGAVPYAVRALTVPDGSIMTAQLADGAVTRAKVDGSAVATITDTQTLTNKTLGVGTKVSLGADAVGDIYYRDVSDNLARLAPGASGQYLQTQGAGANPVWADGGGTTGITGQVKLGGLYYLSALNTWEQPTGMEVTLPTAGTYLLWAFCKADINSTAGVHAGITAHLYNSTDGVPVADSEASIVQGDETGVNHASSTMLMNIVKVTAAKTIQLRVKTYNTTSTISRLIVGGAADADSVTRMGYIKLSN